ncbi:DUF305 domain-containing protein [Sphingosinicella rhizophila]|uniref:DUF305 domain-containing protein n=1 Tax=Sphingosinicella rhizophila TaxID=3050082 RepID=A0ABU3QB44_9SPHN|nr:DUF305 domain-containing protein [Sphingosinicella sp. GR2756]MDT9600512.1 DUF305 domain-containing protein [Sphingosinicella sp. GR2756]
MSRSSERVERLCRRGLIIFGLAATAGAGSAQEAPIVQPGAPGQATRSLSAAEAVRIADTRFSPDDVRFMQDMIRHHYQAVQMVALVKDRTNRKPLVDMAGRIDASQADEIALMQKWLKERGQTAPDPGAAHAMGATHGVHEHGTMVGMATPEQMAALAAAKGNAFDRLFLERMIAHHEGAVKMVDNLLKQPGSAYDPVLFEFTSDVKNEQGAEIKRMSALLAQLSDDPRSTLAPGFRNAGQAISNLTLVASLPKPAGFFDRDNPAGLPPPKPADPAKDKKDGKAAAKERDETDAELSERSPLLNFANTDMAFAGDLLAVGNYHGFNLYRLGAGGVPRLISSVVCPGGQGDVSIAGNILIMSVEQTRARTDCGLQGISEEVSPERFRGLRIFDISNPSRPVQVGQVQTCRGSHTHSIVSSPDAKDAIIVYNSGISSVRDDKELKGCVGDVPGDDRTALFRIDVIEIPLSDPSRSRIIDSPAVFADRETGRLAGLWEGGDHGKDTQETSRTDQCHDITAFPTRKLAAGACSGNGIIFDISDPRKPQRIDAVVDKGFAYWHSATFNNDGTKVLFTDEWGGGSRPRCRAQDPRNWGANAIYDIVDRKLEYRSHYKLTAAQGDQENCVAHNGSIIPVPGRDIFVQAWYQGGISVIDFTDSANLTEIAYFDRGPVDEKHLVLGGFWSVYWYDGRIYGTEITRGLDVLTLKPSAYLTENEIGAAKLADQGRLFNPQQQFPVTWPDHPVVALAYVDQLKRGQTLPPSSLAELEAILAQAKSSFASGRKDPALARSIETLAAGLQSRGADAATARRIAALEKNLEGIAAKLR